LHLLVRQESAQVVNELTERWRGVGGEA
jgi:hypothetical protein